jgi:hypothetical protein
VNQKFAREAVRRPIFVKRVPSIVNVETSFNDRIELLSYFAVDTRLVECRKLLARYIDDGVEMSASFDSGK